MGYALPVAESCEQTTCSRHETTILGTARMGLRFHVRAADICSSVSLTGVSTVARRGQLTHEARSSNSVTPS